jgi:hypothetical protein
VNSERSFGKIESKGAGWFYQIPKQVAFGIES